MKFYNKERPVATTCFGIGLVILVIIIGRAVNGYIKAVDFPPLTELNVGKLPGRVLIDKSVPWGTYQITVPWRATSEWGDDAITAVSMCSRRDSLGVGKIKIDASRPDKKVPGAYEIASTEKEIRTISSVAFNVKSFEDGTVTLVKKVSGLWVFFQFVYLFFVGIFIFISHEVMISFKARRYNGGM